MLRGPSNASDLKSLGENVALAIFHSRFLAERRYSLHEHSSYNNPADLMKCNSHLTHGYNAKPAQQ